MGYQDHANIVASGSLRLRIAACAATEIGETDPTFDAPRWVAQNIWTLPKADWQAAWASAEAGDPGGDHGANEGAVTDAMILAAVQPRLTP
jgi:hypothetical protein